MLFFPRKLKLLLNLGHYSIYKLVYMYDPVVLHVNKINTTLKLASLGIQVGACLLHIVLKDYAGVTVEYYQLILVTTRLNHYTSTFCVLHRKRIKTDIFFDINQRNMVILPRIFIYYTCVNQIKMSFFFFKCK